MLSIIFNKVRSRPDLARRADRAGPLFEQQLVVELGRPVKVVAPDGEIDAAAKAEGAAARHQVYVQLRVQGLEGGPARDQPAHQKGGFAGEHQRLGTALLAQGLRSKEIAYRLDLSVRTVEAHRQILMQILAVRNGIELVRRAEELGLVSLRS